MKGSGVLMCCVVLLASPAFADTIWDESVDGDISTVPLAPTQMTLVSSADRVSATIGGSSTNSPPEDFYDTFTFTVPPGNQVTAVVLADYQVSGGNTSTGFNFYTGNQGEGGTFVGSVSMTTADIGSDLLTLSSVPAPLAPGDYSISMREGTAGQIYQLEIQGDVPVELQSFSVE